MSSAILRVRLVYGHRTFSLLTVGAGYKGPKDDLYDVSDRGVKTFEARSHRPSINNTTGSDLQYGQYRGRHQRVVHLLCGVGPVLEYVSFLALL